MKCDYLIIPTIIFFIVFFELTNNVFPDPTDGLLGDDISFEEIFTDLPQNFDIETAKVSEFSNLPYFDDETARNIVSFRDSLKAENSLLSNLENITELSPIHLAILNHLSATVEYPPFYGFSGYYRNGFIYDPEQEKFSEGKYYFKIRADNEKKFLFTALGERDPFEPRVLDLLSANISIKLEKSQTNIVIGDYRPEFGQKLVFSRYGRNYANGTDVKAGNTKVIDNTLFEEALYQRGVYLETRRGKITTQLWYSLRKLDATINESGKAVSIKETGYHYSGTERENLKETINVARVAFDNMNGFKLGIAGVSTRYSPSLDRQTAEKYINYHEGSQFGHVSIDGELKKGYVVLFFEHTMSNKKENATIGGLEIKNEDVQSCLNLRNYSRGYWAPRAGSFSSFGNTTNERGIYSAVQAGLPYASKFLVSLDIARTLSRTFSETLPVTRRRFSFMFQSKFRGDITGKIVTRSVKDSGDGEQRTSYRIHLEKKQGSNKKVQELQTTLAWSKSGSDWGPYAEASTLIQWQKLKLNLSIGIFDIPSYKSRFYRYEYDVPGRGLTTAVWGKGETFLVVCSRGLISIRYRFADSNLFNKSNELTVQSDLVF